LREVSRNSWTHSTGEGPALSIRVVEEAGQAIVAALDDVLRDVGKIEARQACHGTSVAMAGTARQGQMRIFESEIGSM